MKIDRSEQRNEIFKLLHAAGGRPVRTTYSYKHGPEKAYDNPRDQIVEHWVVQGAVILILSYMEGDTCTGWDVFLPASMSNSVEKTYHEVEKFLTYLNKYLRGNLPHSQEH